MAPLNPASLPRTATTNAPAGSGNANAEAEMDTDAEAALADAGLDRLQRYYAAYAKFRALLIGPQFMVTFALKAGDVMIMDNRRVLHGRTAFDSTGPRHLRGGYCDVDGVSSKYRAHAAYAAAKAAAVGQPVPDLSVLGRATDLAMWFMRQQGLVTYGEDCTMLSHTLQTAKLAAEAAEDEETVLGCAYHDMGHLSEVSE